MVQLLVVIAILGVIIFDAVALAVTATRADAAAREVAATARSEYGADQSLASVQASAEDEAAEHDAEVVDLAVEGDELTVTVTMSPNTLVTHRIGPLAERLTPTATSTVGLRR